MNKFSIAIIFLAFGFLAACNNTDKKANTGNGVSKTLADSLENEVMDGHNVGMAKYGKLKAMQNKVQDILDSIGKISFISPSPLFDYEKNMKQLLGELKSARAGMDKWMDEYNMDSAVNNIEQRIKYLTEEKIKVSKVKEAILNSLQKADSLLKAKF